MDEVRIARLTAWLRQATRADDLVLATPALLSGGAIQQNWAIDATRGGRTERWVLRTDSAAVLSHSRPRAEEFALLAAACAAGVLVPEPLFLCDDPAILGAPFFVMRRIEGIAAARTVVRSPTPLGGGGEALVAELGRQLARIHAIRPPHPDLAFLGAPPSDPARALLAELRAALDRGRLPRPVLEWGLRALELEAPTSDAVVLCHNDFRTGNYMVTQAALTGILDWEFAGWGDRHADLGWFCAPYWRFGGAGEAGGMGPRAAFVAGYKAESGVTIDPSRLRWWERAATIRWAVIAIDQAERHISGAEPSLSLALTGHVLPQLEVEIMRTHWPAVADRAA